MLKSAKTYKRPFSTGGLFANQSVAVARICAAGSDWKETILRAMGNGATSLPKLSSNPRTLREFANRLFVKLLCVFAERGRRVYANLGQGYAPSFFDKHPEAERITTAVHHFDMDVLLGNGVIAKDRDGPPAKRASYLSEVTR